MHLRRKGGDYVGTTMPIPRTITTLGRASPDLGPFDVVPVFGYGKGGVQLRGPDGRAYGATAHTCEFTLSGQYFSPIFDVKSNEEHSNDGPVARYKFIRTNADTIARLVLGDDIMNIDDEVFQMTEAGAKKVYAALETHYPYIRTPAPKLTARQMALKAIRASIMEQ